MRSAFVGADLVATGETSVDVIVVVIGIVVVVMVVIIDAVVIGHVPGLPRSVERRASLRAGATRRNNAMLIIETSKIAPISAKRRWMASIVCATRLRWRKQARRF